MTKIKLCGMTRPCDMEAANRLQPEYIGFVFAKKSRRYVSPERAAELKALLDPAIRAVGVFVQEPPDQVAALLNTGVIDLAQLHGDEDEAYIQTLRGMTDKPIIQAFRIDSEADIAAARASSADLVLLDSGAGGTGTTFDWTLLRDIGRDWFLAGGLGADNAAEAVRRFHPYGVDVSSGIETDGLKDENKMTAFVRAVRSVPEGDRP